MAGAQPADSILTTLDMAMGMTREESIAHQAESERRHLQFEQEERQRYEAKNIPAKISAGLFGFQERRFGMEDVSTDREDMYAFFAASNPSVTFSATVELKGVRFDEFSFRGLEPVNDEELSDGEVEALKDYAEKIGKIVTEHGGRVGVPEDASLFYMRVGRR